MCFLIKKDDDDKKIVFYDRFFVSNCNFTTEHVKNFRFFQIFFSNSRFPGKVATLILDSIYNKY